MTDWTDRTDTELLAAARIDADAFAAFYDRYEMAIVGYFVRRVSDTNQAADMAAETFARALGGAERYQAGGPTAAGWLFTIAQNVLYQSARRGRVQDGARRRLGMAQRLDLSDASRERVEAAVAGEDWVEHVLQCLGADQRAAVRAHIVEDRSYAEIAREHGTSEAVIRQRVSRGLTRLRRNLERTA